MEVLVIMAGVRLNKKWIVSCGGVAIAG